MCVLSAWLKISMVMPQKPVQVSYWVDYSGIETRVKTQTRGWLKSKLTKVKKDCRSSTELCSDLCYIYASCKTFCSAAQGKEKLRIKKETRITMQLLNSETTTQNYAFEFKCTSIPGIFLSLMQERKKR